MALAPTPPLLRTHNTLNNSQPYVWIHVVKNAKQVSDAIASSTAIL